MTFEQLLYVYELAKHESLQQTSLLLHISKSALSQSISQLEKELGIPLFERTHSGSKPTRQLIRLMPEIQIALATQTEIKKEAQSMRNEQAKHFVIEYQNTMPTSLLQKLITAINDRSAYKLSFTITANNNNQILLDIQSSKIDAGLIIIDRSKLKDIDSNQSIFFNQIGTSKLRLYLSPSNEFALEKSLTINQLQRLRFVSFNDEYNQKAFSNLENLCGPLPMLLETDDAEAIYDAAVKLNAVFLAREWQGETSTNENIKRLPSIDISNFIDDSFIIGWVLNKHTKNLKLLKQLISI